MRSPCDNLIETLKSFNPDLGDMRLKNAVYKNGAVKINLISDITISEKDVEFLKSSFEKELSGISVTVETHKSLADADIAKRAIYNYLQSKCFSVSHAINLDCVGIISGGKKIKYEIKVLDTVAEYLNRTDVLNELNLALSREYSNDFEGEIRVSLTDEEKPVYKPLNATEDDICDIQVRTVKMCDVLRFCDDESYDTATYIADGKDILGKCYFAGTVVEKEVRQSKKGNNYHRITIDDKTGKITGSFFTSDKNKLQKLEKLNVGSVVILRGELELFNNAPSFIIKGFHLCEFPAGYVPVRRPGKKAPENYTKVFPTPCETSKQEDFFTIGTKVPESLVGKEFVVVDTETTGTDATSDKITEIGAVRIKNGVIVETFQTLVDPGMPLSKNIIELTGITDEMLVGQPKIEEVYPDFYKFLGDAVFVAQNADFDFRFLKNAGKVCGYQLENQIEDTLIIARKKLPFLPNHKLNTICGHFGIEFRHHRALSDAFATAEAFIELARIEK